MQCCVLTVAVSLVVYVSIKQRGRTACGHFMLALERYLDTLNADTPGLLYHHAALSSQIIVIDIL